MGTTWTAVLVAFAVTPGVPPEAAPLVDQPACVITLSADDVRCRAARESAAAQVLEQEIRVQQGTEDSDNPPGCEPECILQHLAAFQRGRDAAAAMVVAYKLVALNARERQLEQFEGRLSDWRDALDKVAKAGSDRPDDSALQAQEDALPDAMTRLVGGRAKLQLQLAAMLNYPVEQAECLVINEPLDVHPGVVDADAATYEALCRRQDLKAIQRLCRCITPDNIDTIRRMLGVIQPGIGLGVASDKNLFERCGLIRDRDAEAEAESRRRQCRSLDAARQRQIRSEVATASVHLEEAYERLRLAESLVATTRGRITQQRKLAAVELSGGGDIVRAELEAFAAEDALIQRQADAREAEILWIASQDRILEGCSQSGCHLPQ